MNRFLILVLAIATAAPTFAQDGYWDKDRATTKEISVGAGDRIVVKSEDFPVGTTEVVYRITLLDDNQKMANSLVSVLKAIPDPTGISQGSAGAVFLMSQISGSDKCTYAIFSSPEASKKYTFGGKPEQTCFAQNSPLNKDARLLSAKSLCLSGNVSNLWFGFESQNWILKQKIVLEIVPWVDKKASRGWTVDNRKSVINLCESSDLGQLLINSGDLCVCLMEKMQQKYTYTEYQKLLAVEKSKAYTDFGNDCLIQKPANKGLLAIIRGDAELHFKNGKYDNAIRLLQSGIVENGNASAQDYAVLGKYYLFSKQFDKAISTLKSGEALDGSNLYVQLHLAHAYLLNDDYQNAKEIHKKYFHQNVSANQSWTNQTKIDFAALQRAGLKSHDFNKILKILQK